MAKKSQQRKQAKALKKRRRDKARSKQQQKAKIAQQPKNFVRHAREFPIKDCWINAGWNAGDAPGVDGLVTVVITREQPDGNIMFASYLLDMFCLGLKDTMFDVNVPQVAFDERALPMLYTQGPPQECPIELAHQLVYQAIDYAEQFEFTPNRDFKYSRYLLEPRGTYEETYDLTFGKDGKPLFVAGPYDNVERIVAKLEKNAGEGNFNFVLPMMDMDNLLYMDDDEDDWDEDDDLDDDDFGEDDNEDAEDADEQADSDDED